MAVDKARRSAFDVWKEFDDRVKLAEKTITTAEDRMSNYNVKLWSDARKYDKSPRLHKLWSEWLSATHREINDYANSLGFSTHLGESYVPDFTGDKSFTRTYRDYWIEQVIGSTDIYFGTGNVTGSFNRFMVFEKYCVKAGFVNELDEGGYAKIKKMIDSCFDYLSDEVEPKVRDYVKLMRCVEDKVKDAENSCAAYIGEHLKDK